MVSIICIQIVVLGWCIIDSCKLLNLHRQQLTLLLQFGNKLVFAAGLLQSCSVVLLFAASFSGLTCRRSY